MKDTTVVVRLTTEELRKRAGLPKSAYVRFTRYPRFMAPPAKYALISYRDGSRVVERAMDESAIRKLVRAPDGATVHLGHHRTSPGFFAKRRYMTLVTWQP